MKNVVMRAVKKWLKKIILYLQSDDRSTQAVVRILVTYAAFYFLENGSKTSAALSVFLRHF